MKAVGIVSGGLDSLLAVRMVQNMNIEVVALHFVCGFEPIHLKTQKQGQSFQPPSSILETKAACRLLDIRKEFLEILANPAHGYGSGLNPCIDCKILMLCKAKDEMESLGAVFVFTGEVLGQRPMSQRRQIMNLIATKSGLEGCLLRPLCGGLLPPTDAEKRGLILRNQFETIQGRGRTRQFELAQALHVHDFPTPAGGCLLTDPGYASRARELMERRPAGLLRLEDPLLLSIGRHFVLPEGAKAVIGRNQHENPIIMKFAMTGTIIEATEVIGPTTLVEGAPSTTDLQAAACLTAKYGQGRNLKTVTVQATTPDGSTQLLTVAPYPSEGCRLVV